MEGCRKSATSSLKMKSAPITMRELYRVLHLRFTPHPLRPKALLQALKTLLPYAHWSEKRIRRLLERTLTDARAPTLLAVTVNPPVNEALSRQICRELQGIREAIVIPSVLDRKAQSRYLGIAAANAFTPRFRSGQGLGFSAGQTVYAFASSIWLSPEQISDLRLYALTRCPPSVFGWTAEGTITDLIARHLWHPLTKERFPQTPFNEGILDPDIADADALDFAFVEVGTLKAGEFLFDHTEALEFDVARAKRMGVVAELLGHFFCADGLPPSNFVRPKRWQAVPLSLLRTMVRVGKSVVLFASGEDKAKAILTIYRSQRAGGLLFNTIITDEFCAKALLRLLGRREVDGEEDHQWQRERLKFWVCHWHFANTPFTPRKEVAKRLSIRRSLVSTLLEEALNRGDAQVKVFPPLPEPTYALDMEIALLKNLGLREVRVNLAYLAVGQAAAQLLLEWLKGAEEFAIGLDGERAIRAFVEALNLPHSLSQMHHLKRLELWALHYRPRRKSLWGAGVNDILDAVAIRCHGSEWSEKVLCRPFEGDAVVERLNAVFVSIGAVDEPNRELLRAHNIFIPDLEKAVGTLFSQPSDSTGEPLGEGISQALGSLSLGSIRKAVRQGIPVVGLVANPQRALSALVACRNGLVNCLIADRQTAEQIIHIS
ncbi:DNA-binding transcriptional regulator LsrR, DeoR family [Candidatus Fervidibacteria bacterium JGI MDM2 SSWTFF-3-K9]